MTAPGSIQGQGVTGVVARPRALRARFTAPSARRSELLMAAVFILPALLIYLFFMVVPFIGTLQLSLTNWDGFQEVPQFIGLANYQYLLTDERMSNALLHNLAWVIIGTAAPILIALPLAIILWTGVKGRLFFRTVYFLPNILPLVVVGIVWGWIYNPLFGSLNTALKAIGLGDIARGWLGTPETALFAVLVAAIWGTFGFCVVVLLAGLQNVDVELVDAARVDGANSFQRARHVVIPQLAPVLTTLTAIILIGGVQVFDIVFVMTQGGPGIATEVLATYTYKEAFTRNHVGYGSAVSIVITVLSLVLAVAFVRFRERGR